MKWELLTKPGEEPTPFTIDGASARGLLAECVAAATRSGLTWRDEALLLKPSEELVKLVRLSQQQAVKEGPEE